MAPDVAADFRDEALHHHSDSHLERLVLVANRLPIRAERIGKKLWRLEERDGGGLVSALRGSFPSPPAPPPLIHFSLLSNVGPQ